MPDLRNSRVPDILRELASFGIEAEVHDPLADPAAGAGEYGSTLTPLELLRGSGRAGPGGAASRLPRRSARPGSAPCSAPAGIVIDVKSALDPARLPAGQGYWSL